MNKLFDVANKVVLVTGGARGIGRMIAEGFTAAGASVIITARRLEAAELAASEMSEQGNCTGLSADLATAQGADHLISALLAATPRLDVLVNNAGATWGAPLEDYPDEAFDKVWAVNVKGPFRLIAGLLPLLLAASDSDDPSRVINIGSVDGTRSPTYEAYAYSATKAALHMLTRHLARQLAPSVTVNALAPGPFPTKMIKHVTDDDVLRQEALAQVPLKRFGTPEDIAGSAIFLASRAGAYLTGSILPIDGGVTTQ